MSTIRIAVVGDSGCGKTSLAHLISSGRVLKRPKLTVGCNVHLKLLDAGSSGTTSREAPCIELWDIGAQERYRSLWPLFLTNLSGVILVYDLSSASSTLAVTEWAEFVARQGTFKCPLVDEQAGGRLGGLAVPYLLVGNKSDLKGSRGGSTLALASRLWEWLVGRWQALLQRKYLRGLAGTLPQTRSSVAKMAAFRADSTLASARRGLLDQDAFDAFFSECMTRSTLGGASVAAKPSQRSPLAASGTSIADGTPALSISTYRGARKGVASGVKSPQGLSEEPLSPWTRRLGSGWSDQGRIDDDEF